MNRRALTLLLLLLTTTLSPAFGCVIVMQSAGPRACCRMQCRRVAAMPGQSASCCDLMGAESAARNSFAPTAMPATVPVALTSALLPALPASSIPPGTMDAASQPLPSSSPPLFTLHSAFLI